MHEPVGLPAISGLKAELLEVRVWSDAVVVVVQQTPGLVIGLAGACDRGHCMLLTSRDKLLIWFRLVYGMPTDVSRYLAWLYDVSKYGEIHEAQLPAPPAAWLTAADDHCRSYVLLIAANHYMSSVGHFTQLLSFAIQHTAST